MHVQINHCNNNLIDEPIENFVCSDLDVIDKPKESLSDNIIVNNEFNPSSHICRSYKGKTGKGGLFGPLILNRVNCDAHIIENTDDSNGNRNEDSHKYITLSDCFRPTNINETFRIDLTSNSSTNRSSSTTKTCIQN